MSIREDIFNQVEKILMGPIPPMEDPKKETDVNPFDFYITGILYPQLLKTLETEDNKGAEEEKKVGDVDGAGNEENGNQTKIRTRKTQLSDPADDMLELTTKFRPSVAGMSFLVKYNMKVKVKVSFAVYKSETREVIKKYKKKSEDNKSRKKYYRRILIKEEIDILLDDNAELTSSPKLENSKLKLNNDHAALSVIKRKYTGDNNCIITLSLINEKIAHSFAVQRNAEDCLFEISIKTDMVEGGGFLPFTDHTDEGTLSNEDLNIKLLYRNYKNYALGHGSSVNWDYNDTVVKSIRTEVFPVEKVNGIDMDPFIFRDTDVLYIKKLTGRKLSEEYQWESVKSKLVDFVELYSSWIQGNRDEIVKNNEGLSSQLLEQARKNLEICVKLRDRMLDGIKILDDKPYARKAFEDANMAMFNQRIMSDFSKHRQVNKRVLHTDDSFDDAMPEYSKIPFDAIEGLIWANGKLKDQLDELPKNGVPIARWRPFQLAFILCELNGIVNPDHRDRETVDLIWFPTGGGKTEAYLGLTAFSIFYRRLKQKEEVNNPDLGAGVSVLMRYTLRLLNKQQFERASVLICACDLIRRNEPENYGKIRISNGIWVGSSLTPNAINNRGGQINSYKNYLKTLNRNKLPDVDYLSPPLLSCPCCGNRLVKELKDNYAVGRWGYFRKTNIRNQETGPYLMTCTNTKCHFYTTNKNFNISRLLPIYEVDEVIYEKRPSLLFSTVDKFVMLAWKKECIQLFNLERKNGDLTRVFPTLDLILQDELHLISSALGTSYGVFEFAIDELCIQKEGNKPKIVGATATVRDAETQCKKLYARKHFMQFPPPGINTDDSFYAIKKVADDNARMYVGFMPSGVTTSTALIRLTSVLLDRIPALKQYTNEELDSYYTLVVYFNALKELGKFRTFLEDDIVGYRQFLAKYYNTLPKSYALNRLCELSSILTADEITKSLDKLEKTRLPDNFQLAENRTLQNDLYQLGLRNLKDFQIASGRSLIINKGFFDKFGLNFEKTPDGAEEKVMTEINKKNYQTALGFLSQYLGEQDPAHITPATNMISVGVDIPRLNTMIVNGQPKTSTEYIQASSRIGRRDPGIVFTFLAPTKNRDRSHYEQYKDFHQAYYRHVETSSVTPESEQALEKMIPTVIVALLKSLHSDCSREILNSHIDRYTEALADRFPADSIYRIGKEMKNMINNLSGERRFASYMDYAVIDHITQEFRTVINQKRHQVYNAPAHLGHRLREHILTLQTLRNVEQNSEIKIK